MFAANKTRHRLSGPGGGFTLFENGTSSFVVPAGVTSISAVAIGGGGGGRDSDTANIARESGGGGALAWSPSIAVTPGEALTLVVGASGFGGNPATSGSSSSISRGGTTLLLAAGGTGAAAGAPGVGGSATASVGQFRFSGGDGSSSGALPRGGGGGAAGFYGDGGGNNNTGNGSGGGGGMGGNLTTDNQFGETVSGGGTFPFGHSGFSGGRGANNARGYMGSSATSSTEVRGYSDAQAFGFGGGGSVGAGGYGGGRGGVGAIRVLWNTENALISSIPPATPTLVSSQFFQVNASSPPVPTIPAGVQVGDIVLVYTSYCRTDSVNPGTTGTPTNFTNVYSNFMSATGTYRSTYALSKRVVLDAGIAGSNIVIPSDPVGTLVVGVFVFRSATGLNVYSNNNNISIQGLQTTNIAISNSQTFNSSNQTGKGVIISLAFLQNYDGFAPNSVTWNGATQLTTGINTLRCYYKIYPFSATSTDDSVTANYGSGVRSGVVLPLTGY